MKYNFDEVIDRSDNFSAKYDELEAKFGRSDLVSLWVADMDFRAAEPIMEAIRERAEQGIFGYTSRPESYYKTMKNWYKTRYNWDMEKDHIIHSPGVVPTLSLIMKLFTEPGDKIIIQSPVYYPFFNVVKDNERELVINPLKKVDGDYFMDFEDLENKIDEKVKFLILCNPHNPIGRVWTKEELRKLGDMCIKNNITVIADEIHGDLVYDGKRYTPFASISEEFRLNSISCLSATKTFNIAGLQASFAVFPDKEMHDKFDEFLGILDIKRNNCFSLVAMEAAYAKGGEWLDQVLVYIRDNMKFVNEYCEKHMPQIKANMPEGTYLVWLDCNDLGLSDDALNDFFVNKARVALDGGSWFGEEGKGYMRINVACPRATLKEGLDRIKEAIINEL
ncbi:MAG: pyridoxal phosphate-dependent aminotransferase [Firmicutes bacterium]|jgi:cystathionine beta-lyase|nr:pyridoxal phosphate-dependent aminotransferase [Bacillota bacterium]